MRDDVRLTGLPFAEEQMAIPLTLQVRVLNEYDINYMRDRMRADIFVGGQPAGAYAIMVPDQDMMATPSGRAYALRHYGGELADQAVREWLSQPGRLREEIFGLKVQLAELEKPWWRRMWERAAR